VTSPNVRPLDPRRICEADRKLTADVFERLACGFSPLMLPNARREELRRIARNLAASNRRRPA